MEWNDGKCRCAWANPQNPKYIEYHDREWGRQEHDDGKLFEMLILESFQAGLSWECVLNKREAFRRAFEGFDPERVAAFTEEKQSRLKQDQGIIRNGLKIRAAVENAKVFFRIREEYGSFDAYLREMTGDTTVKEWDKTSSELSDRLSADLKKRGMKFVGTVIIYSFLQAIGVIRSHTPDCFLFEEYVN